jgi:hypothetical protein
VKAGQSIKMGPDSHPTQAIKHLLQPVNSETDLATKFGVETIKNN